MSVKVNAKEVLSNLDKMFKVSPKTSDRAIGIVADKILQLSANSPFVPHDKGTLAGTGSVQETGIGSRRVGFNTPYAARLHEHPEYRFQKGRQGKFLERPIQKNMAKMNKWYGEYIKANLL